MSLEIKVPVLPESVADATIVTWHKKPGEAVKRDENLVDIETDKVVLEVAAPDDGAISEIIRQEGDTVLGEELIAKFAAGSAPVASVSQAPVASSAPEAPALSVVENKVELSPSARRAAKESDVDVANVSGTGKSGRITKQDIEKVAGARDEKRVPMTRLRAKIAERLVDAQQTAAMLTTFNEINMQPVVECRKKYKEAFEKEYGVKLGFMSFFVKASVAALQKFPAVNASIDGKDIVYHGYQDVGIAVSSPRGLVVPIIRNAENLSMADIEKTIMNYGMQARDGKLSIEDMTGGTFTISNGGTFGSLLSTPILNPPQSGILGMHKTQERAVVENGNVVVRPMMYVALSYDHRIIDGSEAVRFLVTIKDMLEDPTRLVLGV